MKKIKWTRWHVLELLLLIVIVTAFTVIFSTLDYGPYGKYKPPPIPPNLECFQVVGTMNNLVRYRQALEDYRAGREIGVHYKRIEVYWCRDRNDRDACYWWNPNAGIARTRCNKTIFKEND